MIIHELRIPLDRVGVLIGKEGEVKKDIESSFDISVRIDSVKGDVEITGDDAVKVFDAKEVIRAVGLGFNPKIAMNLQKGDYSLEVIDASEFVKKSSLKKAIGRVIGKEGRSKKIIEEISGTDIVIYNKHISILGELEGVYDAKKALESLLKGSKHSSVYKFLEKRRSERKNILSA